VKSDNGERRVSEKFIGPMGTHRGALRPGQRRALRADPAALPFGFGIPDKAVRALIEHVIGNGNFAGGVGRVRAIVAEDEDAIGMSGVDQHTGELREAVTSLEQRRPRARFDDEITNALRFVKEHQAVLVGDAADVAANVVRRIRHRINPIPLAEIPGINAAIANLAANRKGRERKAY